MVSAGEPAGEASHGPDRVMDTFTASFGPTNTLFDVGGVSVTRTEKGYSTVVPTCWFRVMRLTRGALRASLSASPWTASATAAEAVSMSAVTAASASIGALRRCPIQRLPSGRVARASARSVRQEVSAEWAMTLDD